MRCRVRLLLAVALSVGVLTGCASGATRHAMPLAQHPSPTSTPEATTPAVTLAYFRAGLGVVGVSGGCCGYEGAEPSKLWITTDMRHWRDVTPNGPASSSTFRGQHPVFSYASFIDDRSGWVTTWDPANIAVRIFRTAGGGRSWTSVSGGVQGAHPGAVAAVQPLSPTFAFKEHLEPTGPGMDLSVTHDGGRHWKVVYSGPPPRAHHEPLRGPFEMPMVFTTGTRGFGADGIPAADPGVTGQPNPGYLFTTDDGGRSWGRLDPPRPQESRRCPDADEYTSTVTCLDGLPVFGSQRIGVLPVVVREPRRAVVGFDTTDDGGAKWTKASSITVTMPRLRQSTYDAAYDFTTPLVSIASRNTWWVGVADGKRVTSFSTSDAGRVWRRARSLLPGTPDHLWAVGPKQAWMTIDVPADGPHERTTELFTTTDGGRTWRNATPGL